VIAVWHSWTSRSAAAGVTLTSGTPTRLAFTVQPAGSVAGATISAAKVSVEDAAGNVVVTDNSTAVTLTISTNPGGGTLSGGGQVTVSSGVATYPGLSIDRAGTGYTLRATDTTDGAGAHPYAAGMGSAFDITPAPATRLVFSTQPGSATAGAPFGRQPVVETQDSFGNDSTVGLGASRSVTISLLSGTGTLTGTATLDIGLAAGDGVVSFGGLALDAAGTKTVQATASAGSLALGSATSAPFAVGEATPTLTGPGGPGAGTAGTAIAASAITATLGSSSGANASGTVTFSYFQQASAPTSCASGGTPVGTATVSGNGSYSPGSGFTPTVAGTYWLSASYTGDANNQSAASACPPGAAQEIIVSKAAPTLTTTAPATAAAGTPIAATAITATLAASSGTGATGTLTFTVFGPQPAAPSTCSSGGTTIGTATAAGNNSYHPSTGYTPTTAGTYWWYASYTGDTNNQPATSTCGPAMAQTTVSYALVFSSCTVGTGGIAVNCPASGGATVSLKRANQGGGSWTAKVTLTDGAGNPVVNTTGGAITVTVAKVTSGSAITYSSGSALTIPNGASQSSSSFTYANAGVPNGGGTDTATGSAAGYASAVGNISW
jgi:hypothetical protein